MLVFPPSLVCLSVNCLMMKRLFLIKEKKLDITKSIGRWVDTIIIVQCGVQYRDWAESLDSFGLWPQQVIWLNDALKDLFSLYELIIKNIIWLEKWWWHNSCGPLMAGWGWHRRQWVNILACDCDQLKFERLLSLLSSSSLNVGRQWVNLLAYDCDQLKFER